MRTLVIALLVAIIASAVAGCGSDADHARDTVETYLGALADGDGGKACDQLTGDARREFILTSGESDCAGAAHVAADQLSDSEKDKLRNAKVTVTTKADAEKSTANAAPGDVQKLTEQAKFDAIAHVEGGSDVPLVKEDGDFKIAGMGVDDAGLNDAFSP